MAATAGSCFAAIFADNSNGQRRLSALGLGAWKFDVVTAISKLISFCCDAFVCIWAE
jgi:hypothetical protein